MKYRLIQAVRSQNGKEIKLSITMPRFPHTLISLLITGVTVFKHGSIKIILYRSKIKTLQHRNS